MPPEWKFRAEFDLDRVKLRVQNRSMTLAELKALDKLAANRDSSSHRGYRSSPAEGAAWSDFES